MRHRGRSLLSTIKLDYYYYYPASGKGAEYCCDCICPRAYLRNQYHMPNLSNFLCMTHGRGLVLLWERCDMYMLRTSGFVDDVKFADNDRSRRREKEVILSGSCILMSRFLCNPLELYFPTFTLHRRNKIVDNLDFPSQNSFT